LWYDENDFDSDLSKQILQINKIRNKFAHNLNIDLKSDLIEFIKVVFDNEQKHITTTPINNT